MAPRQACGLAVDERRAVLAGAGLGLGLCCAKDNSGNVRDCVVSSFFFLLFLFFCSGEVWDVGQRRIALTTKVSYIFFPFCDAWVQIAGQVPTDLVEMICQF